MKKLLSVLLAVVIMCGTFSAAVYAQESDLNSGLPETEEAVLGDSVDFSEFFTYEMLDAESVILTSFEDCPDSNDVNIPTAIDGFKVVGLGEFLFEGSDVKNVYIPSQIEKIHNTAFSGASELTEITVEQGGLFASFEGGLYSSDLSVLYKYPEGARDVTFPENLTEIGAEAFRNSAVSEITVPDAVSVIGEGAFSYSSLENVTLPESITAIPDWAFAGCESLSSVNLENVTEIGGNAFRGCKSLADVTLSYALTTIGAAAFHGTALVAVTVPNGVEAIGEKAFGYYSMDDIEFVKAGDFTIYGKSGTAAQTYADENGFLFEDNAPKAPVIFYGYADTVAVTVFWSIAQDADYYEIYRKTDDGDYKKIAVTADNQETVYCDLAVKNGETYTYSIVAVKGNLNSGIENELSVKFIKLATPVLKSAQMTREGILVKWDSVKSAEGYMLYRCTENSGWVQIAEFKGNVTSFTDTTADSGVNYTYTVKAYCNEVESSCDFEGVSAMYLSIPKLTKIGNSAKGMTVKWNKVQGADGYIIGRKTSKTSWTKIAQVGDVSSYNDKTAKPGTTYTYTVVPVSDDVKGFYDEAGITYKCIAKVTTKSASNGTKGVNVTWSPVSYCSGYYVYRKAAGATAWTKIATVKGAKSSTYTDKKAKSGVEYTYTVKAYSGSYGSAYDSKGKTVVFLSTPVLSGVKSAKSGVTLKWEKVSGAGGYYVYRKTGSSGWERIANVKNGKTLSYLDKTAKKGVTYTYTVRAYKGSTKSGYNTKGISVKDKY